MGCTCSHAASAQAYHEQFTIETSEPGALAGPFPLNGREAVRVDVVPEATGWVAGVLELVYRLAPGCPFRSFDPAVTFTPAAPHTETAVDCIALRDVYVKVTTVNGTALKAQVHFTREA